jgi:SAM-dependent methyltransferase
MINNSFLSCPVCGGKIVDLYCTACNTKFPCVSGKPVLINQERSLFSFDDYKEGESYSFSGKEKRKVLSILKKLIPKTEDNYYAKSNYQMLKQLVLTKNANPEILIVGGGFIGSGIGDFLSLPEINFTVTDVSMTDIVDLICDCHDLPFQSKTFDCVIVQAVLEHVQDPYRCVDEIHRVLKEDGFVYAETPFMQQVHGGAYDFTRFTWLGHRRLFRKFEELSSGACCGPGMALAWSWKYFLKTFSENRIITLLLGGIADYTSFFWHYFDKYLINKRGSLDCASGNYFIGCKKTDFLLSDRELIDLYKQRRYR